MMKEITTVKPLRERERESKSSTNKLIVWGLFDDAFSSYKKAVQKHFPNTNNNVEIEIHSIGINDIYFDDNEERFFYHLIDLSITNPNLIEKLSQLPKPDIILASPPCESWSTADCNGQMIIDILDDGTWYVKNKKFYDEYNSTCHPVKRRHFEQKEISRLIGEATIAGTIKIIKHFNPKVWVIENPKTSKIWKFQKYHWNFEGFENITYYSSYDDNFSLKPTIFKSNIKLKLEKKINKNSNSDHMAKGNYATRSKIPSSLIKEILIQAMNEIFE